MSHVERQFMDFVRSRSSSLQFTKHTAGNDNKIKHSNNDSEDARGSTEINEELAVAKTEEKEQNQTKEAAEESRGEIEQAEDKTLEAILKPRSSDSTESVTHLPSLTRCQRESIGSLNERPSSLLTPFKLLWSYGVNTQAKALNLTNRHEGFVFYSCANSGFLYNYETKVMQLFQGHKNPITSMDIDQTGKWLVTSDVGEDHAVIIWDVKKRLPICTLFAAHSSGASIVAISDNAKYLVTIGSDDDENCTVLKFWLWTYGNDDGDDSYSFGKSDFGKPLHVTFNMDVQEHFMVTFEGQVVFFTWDVEEKQLMYSIPQRRNTRSSGDLVQSAYMKYCHECVTCTTNGFIVMWGKTLFNLPLGELAMSNDKIYVKTLQVQKYAINCIKSIDKYVATGDVKGFVKFYDSRMEIVYWFQSFNLPSIVAVCFDLFSVYSPQRSRAPTKPDFDVTGESLWKKETSQSAEDQEKIKFNSRPPSGADLSKKPFYMRNFIVVTAEGRIGRINVIKRSFEYILNCYNEHPVTAIDVHDEKNYLCVCNLATKIHIYDYIQHKMLCTIQLTKTLEMYEKSSNLTITCIRFSPEGLHLGCGLSNGDVWFLEPVLLTPLYEHPLKKTKYPIEKIVFSINSKFFAFYDTNMLVCAFRYGDDSTWSFLGKIRSHYKPIVDISFSNTLPVRLFTIGEDRTVVEYELYRETNIFSVLTMTFREQFDQFPVPTCFTFYPKNPKSVSKDKYFLIADDSFKLKLICDTNASIKCMYLGPTYDTPIKKLLVRKHEDADAFKYVIFHTNRHIGMQMLPTDGNPFKYVGMVGHPDSILDMALSGDGKYLFTAGKNDSTVQMWSVNTEAVFEMEKLGGKELEPFYSLVEGGKDGWLFKEMQDLFYYMQILHQTENPNLPRTISDFVPIEEITDLVRAVGFYPSQFEAYNLITDITYRNYDETVELEKVISFHDFVKLYLNHRPPFGVSFDKLQKAFKNLAKSESEFNPELSREFFIEAMCTLGEPMRPMEMFKYFSNVYHFEGTWKEDKHMKFIPSAINFKRFMEEILGIDYIKGSEETFRC